MSPENVNRYLVERIETEARRRSDSIIIGICGSQGSGKSTMSRELQPLLEDRGLPAAVISIDDLYLTRRERLELGKRVHPLLRTRGVPGTHDVDLGLRVLDSLRRQGIVPIPSFDKARDDRCAPEFWPRVDAPVRVIIVEGWCVGARPQEERLLSTSINEFEREFDVDGSWRRYVNNSLAGKYQELFARLDLLILMQAPSFDVVYSWRLEQEHKLRQSVLLNGQDDSLVMTDAQVKHFISHYERLTRHILAEMPSRAHIVVSLDASRGRTIKARQ